jgi:DNA-3-methyladenine glycosylase
MVARDLIGGSVHLADSSESWIIVETEAYGDETDLASHAAVYRRARGEIMRRNPGSLYVYLSYGIHHCLNVVSHLPGGAGAVLIRALEFPNDRRSREASGPGKVSRSLGVERDWDGLDVLANPFVSIGGAIQRRPVVATSRIGITRDVHRLWRFAASDSLAVSGRPAVVASRT